MFPVTMGYTGGSSPLGGPSINPNGSTILALNISLVVHDLTVLPALKMNYENTNTEYTWLREIRHA